MPTSELPGTPNPRNSQMMLDCLIAGVAIDLLSGHRRLHRIFGLAGVGALVLVSGSDRTGWHPACFRMQFISAGRRLHVKRASYLTLRPDNPKLKKIALLLLVFNPQLLA